MILDSKKERIKELEAELAVVTRERDAFIANCDDWIARHDAAANERDKLRLQLRNIREACEKLREAAFPLTVTQVRRFPKKGAERC